MHFEKSNDASTHNIARMSEVDNQRKWDVEVQAECMHVFVRDRQILWELCSVALSRVLGFLELERQQWARVMCSIGRCLSIWFIVRSAYCSFCVLCGPRLLPPQPNLLQPFTSHLEGKWCQLHLIITLILLFTVQ